MKTEIKDTIKAEISDLKATLDGQQEKLTQLIEIIDKESIPTNEQSDLEPPTFDFKVNGVSRRDMTRQELKSILESLLELTHIKHPELEITISKVESETNQPVTLTNSQIGKGIRHDDSISIKDETNRLIGDFKIEFTENGIKDISAQYYKAFWSNVPS